MNHLDIDAGIRAIGHPLADSVENLEAQGFSRDQVNDILRAIKPLLTHIMLGAAKQDRTEREARTQAQRQEGTGP